MIFKFIVNALKKYPIPTDPSLKHYNSERFSVLKFVSLSREYSNLWSKF